MALISIVTPVYNSSAYLHTVFSSVLNQSCSDWEWLLVDDCSDDDSWVIITELLMKDSRIKAFRNDENQGAGFSRNRAIKEASGRFIAFLDADDLWLPNKLEKQVSFMLENDYALTYTAYQKFNSQGDRGIVYPPESVSYNQLLYSNVIGCLTAMYDTKRLGKRFMPLIRKRQDMGLWLEILKDIPKAYCLNEVLAKYRTDSGMTSNKLKVLGYQWKFYREVVGLSLLRSSVVFVIYGIKGLLKSRI